MVENTEIGVFSFFAGNAGSSSLFFGLAQNGSRERKDLCMNVSLEKEFGSRLIDLQTGARGLRGGVKVKTSVPVDAGEDPVVDFVSSDETLDRYNEVICASGWVLDRYLQNPVFQDSHDYSTILRTIGRAVVTEVRNGKLFQRVRFAVEVNPLAKIGYAMYRNGFLHAVSVGFIPVEWENGDVRSGFSRRYLKQELLETSAVAIPANPNALELACKAGAVEKGDLRDLCDMLRELVEGENFNFAGSESDAGAPGLGTDGAQLVELMREVAAVCRRA